MWEWKGSTKNPPASTGVFIRKKLVSNVFIYSVSICIHLWIFLAALALRCEHFNETVSYERHRKVPQLKSTFIASLLIISNKIKTLRHYIYIQLSLQLKSSECQTKRYQVGLVFIMLCFNIFHSTSIDNSGSHILFLKSLKTCLE